MTNYAVIIPARLKATRLPNKPLLKINDKEMILHVLERAKLSGADNIFIACAEEELATIVRNNGGIAIMTHPDLPSGTDRVYSALKVIEKTENKTFDYVVNLQGDMPDFHPSIIQDTINILIKSSADIASLCAETSLEEALKDSVVKPVLGNFHNGYAKAIYFSRSLVPNGATKYYHHIGIYGFTRAAIEKFISFPQTLLEQSERLEQLRALENNMTIAMGITNHIPISVDTPQDLERAREIMKRL